MLPLQVILGSTRILLVKQLFTHQGDAEGKGLQKILNSAP